MSDRNRRLEVNPNQISKKEVFKYLVAFTYVSLHNQYIMLLKCIHIFTDFFFKRYFWYRKIRKAYSVKIMNISHGDARNHAISKWKIIDEDNQWGLAVYLKKIQNKYFILEVWDRKEQLDIVKKFGIDSNKLKQYSRNDKIDDLLR